MNITLKKAKRKIWWIQVHCTASREGEWQTVDDIWEIQRKRTDSKFRKIAYNYIVYLDGTIHEGRDVEEQPAGIKYDNKGAIAVVYVGGTITNPKNPKDPNGLPKDTRTLQQKESLDNLIRELCKLYEIKEIVGHYERAKKSCPCFNAKKEYNKYINSNVTVQDPYTIAGNFPSYNGNGGGSTVQSVSNTDVERNPCPPSYGSGSVYDTTSLMQPAEKFSGNTKEVCKKCYNYFRQNGCSDACAKGILANIYAESSFNYSVLGWDGSTSSGHFGIGGGLIGFYYNGLLKNIAKFYGKTTEIDNLNTAVKNSGLPYPRVPCSEKNRQHIKNKGFVFPFGLEDQLNYLVKECIKSNVKTMSDPRVAAKWWIDNVEKPSKRPDRWALYGNTINKMLE